MGSLPTKAVTGANFKKWTVETLNKLIDYLHGARIKPGYGIMVRETPSGTIVELAKKQAPVVNNTTGGGTGVTQDISASVSGGTASVTLSGSTSAVEFVGTGDVTITGNTNGQIEINATGGGGGGGVTCFPDYANPIESGLELDTFYGPYANPVWLIGTVEYDMVHQTDYTGYDFLEFRSSVRIILENTGGFNLTDCHFPFSPGSSVLAPYVAYLSSFVNIPIPQGVRFKLVDEFEWGGGFGELAVYPCISAVPLADYTVTRASGNTNGTLFYGLSQQGENTVSIDSSLDGTPLDFEGASVL